MVDTHPTLRIICCMHRSNRHVIFSSAILVVSVAFAGCAGPRAKAPLTQQTSPPLEVSLPGIVIVPATGEVRVDGQVCIERGILEFLAVASQGKAYESLFVLDCKPSQLQVAMLIAGWQQGALPPQVRGDFSPGTRPSASRPAGAPRTPRPPLPQSDTPSGEPTCVAVDVDVRQEDGSWQRRSIESLLVDRRTDNAPSRLAWAFTGSFFVRDRGTGREFFAADGERSIIAMWYDPTALLNITQDVGNPYRGNASGLQIDPAGPLKQGTRVRLVLRPVRQPAQTSR
jgi:hypothetical protein